ncbi:MAG: T9SS type A sorting domain-containing protein [Clostridia bacterium]|nr:T9SS type A sorting domain-containing protein [Clostridia bacterium]
MLLKVYKSRAWLMLLMLLPFLGTVQAQVSPWDYTETPTSAVYAIPTTVAFNGVDALVAGDWVGAFYMDNGVLECAGAIQWTGTANTAVVAFGNDTLEAPDKVGFSEGEMVYWKFYRSATSTEVEVLSTPEFFWTNGFLGDVTAFSPAVPPEVCQDINLVTGTRFISTYIQPADLNFKNVMTDILANLQIAKNSTGATLRKIGPNWVNSIGNLVVIQGYIMTMNAPDLLTICGERVPFDTPIPVEATKLVSYLHDVSLNAVTGFGTILDNLQIAKNGTGATLRKIGPNWVNSIGNLNPGEGYLVSMNAADNLVYPAVDANQASVATKPANTRGHFQWIGGNAAENTWSIYIDVATLDGVNVEVGDEIAILDGNKIVGVRTITEVPIPGLFNQEMAAFNVLGDLTPGYTFGNVPNFILWDQSADIEYPDFEISYSNPYGDAWTEGVFPSINNEYSIAEMTFTGAPPQECPELVSAISGPNIVDLTWNPIGSTPVKGLDTRGHFQWIGGNAAENTWSIYIDVATLDGVNVEVGDEIAILDGNKIVGVRTITEVPIPGLFNQEMAAFNVLGDLTPGYTFGNVPNFILWDQSADIEYPDFEISYSNPYGDAWTQGVFPSINNEYSIAEMTFSSGVSVTTFNVYFENGTLIEANVEGTTYQVTGLEDGTEYCFYVTENLEGGVESCQSNVLCATTDPGCEDVVINNFPAAPADVCFGEAVVIDFSGVEVLNAASITWSVDPITAGAFDGTTFTLDPGYVGFVTVSVFGEATPPCADSTASLTFEVFALPFVECPADFGVCYTVEPFALTGATPEGGEYSGAGVSDGVFDPLFGSIGENEITYTFTDDNGCSNSCTFYITLYDLPAITCPEDLAVCLNEDPIMLTGATPAGGEYTGTGVADGMFDPTEAGEFTITYTYLDVETGCSNWCEFTITVNPLPLVSCPEYDPICVGSEAFEFPEVPMGVYLDADYNTITGFDPIEAGTFEIILDVIDENGCENYCFFNIVVMPLPVVECPEFAAVCAGSEMIDFAAVEGGVYTNEAEEVVLGFNPVEAGVYAFTLTVTDEYGCEGSCDFSITVLESAVVFAGSDATIAEGESYTIEDATVFNTEIVVWTSYGDGAFDDNTMINPTYTPGPNDIAAGQVTLSLFGGGDCPDIDTMVLFIGEVICPNPALADAGDDVTVCADSEAVQLDGYVENAEMFFWSTVTGTGEFSDENILNPTYTPGEGDYLMGSVELCLTAVGLENCDDAIDCMTITFNALPVVTLMAYEPVCEGSEEFMLYGGFPAGGVYYVDGIEMEMFNPEMAGEYDLMYTYTDENGCTNSAMGMIMVNELPEVTLEAYEPVCEGSDEFMLYGGFPAGGVYYVDGIEMEMFNPEMAGEYNVMYMYTDENGCSNFAMGMIFVAPLPVVECPMFAPVCEGSEMIEFPEVEGGVYFDVTGAPVEGFDPMMAGNYDFMLEVTNEYGCSASCTFQIVVNPLPYLMYEASAYTICLGETIDVTVTGPEDGAYPYTVEYTVNGFTMTDVIEDSYLEYELTPEMAGTWSFEVLTITDANGCVSVENAAFEVEVLPLTTITDQPMGATVVYGQPFELTVVAENATGYQWYLNGEMIVGATTDTYSVAMAMPADGGTYYVMVFGECGDVMSDVVTVTITPETQIIDFLGAVNGMSTYLELIEDDMATILGPVLDDLYYVEMKNPVLVWTPSNASFAFNEDKGAKVVLNSGWPTSIEVVGYPTLGTMVNLPAGSSYLPVHSRNVVSAADVFEPLGASLFAVFSMDYSGIYWPSYGVYTLQNLIPGSAYLVVMNAPGVADFDVPAVSAMVPKYTNVPTNMTSWNDMVLTATQHNIAFTADALAGLQIGDVIGAFNEYGQIAGMVEVTSLRDNLVLRAFGDNPATEAVEGFVEGDLISFKVWRNGVEITADATFAANMPNQNVFAKDGISAVEGLKAGVTAINDLSTELTANLYPNPATDVVNINTNFVISNVKVINYVGQVIFESNPAQEDFQINTSNLVSGMYFVQIENTEGYVITKRLTIK